MSTTSPTPPTPHAPSLRARSRAWLPEGRALPESTWRRRHLMIVRFALLQAVAIGGYGLLRGYSLETCAADVAIITVPALLACVANASRRLRTISATVSLMFACAVAVDLSGGITEAHFMFFVMIGVVALYQDWTAFGVCIFIVVAHHAILGTIDPSAVYGSASERDHPIEWALIHGAFVLAACVTHLIAWKANEQQELSDPLTRLANRVGFAEELSRALAEAAEPVSVIFVDLDEFKQVNDGSGHGVGDELLIQVARKLSEVVRAADYVGRLGGDEFAVLIHADVAYAETVAARLLARLNEPIVIGGREFVVRASIGIADSSLAGSRYADDLIRDADLAMYTAKSAGKNRIATYTAGVDEMVRDRANLANDVQLALADGQFEVYYQPVVEGLTGSLAGVEALLRWHHPRRGMVPPDIFIPVAEETGAIRAIGEWVLRTAVGEVGRWQANVPGCSELTLAVNISPVQLYGDNLASIVADVLATSGFEARRLSLEVTEGMLLDDLDLARERLSALRDLGCKIAIDDFGTGYSSLAYLSGLPADTVKIDRSFIKGLTVRSGPSVLVQAVVDMAHALGLSVVAEGVEEQEQQEVLNELNCPLSQGFLYAAALPSKRFVELATSWGDLAEALRAPRVETEGAASS